uniref:Uncharacterized protein n=1 Tax=Graphocephala atropunctata TaxID=36148 RepID=A0A1B6MRC1_9HEMI
MLKFSIKITTTSMIVFYLCSGYCLCEESSIGKFQSDQKLNGGMQTLSSHRWNGTKPPFPRSTQKPTDKSEIKFPKRLEQLKSGKKIEVLRRPPQLTRQKFAFPPSRRNPTLFELLDEIICDSLCNPEAGFSSQVFKNVNRFYHFLQLVKRMFIDKEGKRLEALRYSVFRLYMSKGGPIFARFPINDPENKRKLIEAYSWSDKDFEVLKLRQKQIENTWYRVQMNIFDMNRLPRIKGEKEAKLPSWTNHSVGARTKTNDLL